MNMNRLIFYDAGGKYRGSGKFWTIRRVGSGGPERRRVLGMS
jgi:hypothetical protein